MAMNDFKYRILFCILLIVPLGQIGIDVYMPSLPAIKTQFGATNQLIQLSLSLYVLFFGLSQPIYGILSDRYGRRFSLLTGLSIYIIGTIICAFSTSAAMLLSSRIIQGLGIGSGTVNANGITGDSFQGRDLNKVASYSSTAYALAPIVAPFLGGYIQSFFGWTYNFYFLASITAIVFIVCYTLLPETRIIREEKSMPLLQIFKTVLSNRRYLLCASGMIGAFSIIVCFNTIAPFFFQNTLKLSAVQYGYLALLVGAAYLVGTGSNSKLLSKYNTEQLIIFGSWMMVFSSFAFIILAALHNITWLKYFSIIPIFLCTAGSGFLFPNFIGTSIGLFTDFCGTATSIICCLVLVGCSIFSTAASYLPAGNPIALPTALLAISLFAGLNTIFYIHAG